MTDATSASQEQWSKFGDELHIYLECGFLSGGSLLFGEDEGAT